MSAAMDLSNHRASRWPHYLAWLCLGIAEAVYLPNWFERVVTTVEATVHSQPVPGAFSGMLQGPVARPR